MIESFVFAFSAYAVNGYAAQANASAEARRAPPKRKPTRTRPRMVRRSNAIELAWPAGSESHFPDQPKTRYAGTYIRYETGPYVSPVSLAVSQRPFVWTRSATSPSASAGPHFSRSSRTGMCPYGACPFTIRLAPMTPAYPTSITPRGVSWLRPTRKPTRNTAAAARTHAGHRGRSAGPRRRKPAHAVRATR